MPKIPNMLHKKPDSFFLDDSSLGAATDLYELAMAAGYLHHGMNNSATFELWVRELPTCRSFLLAAGLEQVLHYIENITFSDEVIDYLKSHKMFKGVDSAFFQYLSDFKFSGDIFALPEGSVAFAEEPVLRVTAPLIEAQILETYLMSTINFQTMVASKAARVTLAAKGSNVIDFGTRRAHGIQAGVLAARASYIGGCAGTSNVFAGQKMGIPTMGTVAHSWIMSNENEFESFRRFHETFPEETVLLVDTYDTVKGTRLAAKIGDKLKGVRIDSGNLLDSSKEVRGILDKEGLVKTKIVVSGDLNEYKIDDLVKSGAPIDIYGVGTEMVVSKDSPALSCVYKLVEQEVEGQTVPRLKLSREKNTYPSKKQVYRVTDSKGSFVKDVIGLEGESFKLDGDNEISELLIPVVKHGKICYELPEIETIKQNAKRNVSALPDCYKNIDCDVKYPVSKSGKLEEAKELVVKSMI